MPSPDVGFIPDPLSKEALKALIQEALEKAPTDRSPETFHARFDHLERGLQVDDVIHGLEAEWDFERPPVFNRDTWQWKYYIATETVDGDPLTIIIAVSTTEKNFEVITRWRN